MGVEMHRNLEGGFEVPHQLVGGVRGDQAGHILNADGVGSGLLQLLGVLDKVLVGVDGAQGIAQGNLYVSSLRLGGANSGFQVADVVEGVKDAA